MCVFVAWVEYIDDDKEGFDIFGGADEIIIPLSWLTLLNGGQTTRSLAHGRCFVIA